MNRATEIMQQIDDLETELFKNYDEFMKKDEIIKGLENGYTDFIENNYFSLTKRDLKHICISAMKQLNGTQLMKMYKDLEENFVGYDELMRDKEELEKRIESKKK